jgi:hypothetical protein
MTAQRNVAVAAVLVGAAELLAGCWDGAPSSADLTKAFGGKMDVMTISVLSRCMPGDLLAYLRPLLSNVTVKRVEKLECVKATGKPGYVCTFVADFVAEGSTVEEKTKTCEARFVSGDKGWSATLDPF